MRPGRYRKFPKVEHHVRGPLDPDECFVLMPERDPAAVAAMRAYAKESPDILLASELISWANRIEGIESLHPVEEPLILTRIRTWTAALTKEVKEGRMDIETALQRIAGHAADATADALEET